MKAQTQNTAKRVKSALLITVCAHVILFLGVTCASAQTSLLVEGNCGDPATTSTAPGTCGDYDGDGRIGGAEDEDGDKIYGTFRRAVEVVDSGQNGGVVTVVTSGTFAEGLYIGLFNRSGGSITVQAAPGIEATLDGGSSNTNGVNPQGDAGVPPVIVIGSQPNRYVVLRNLTIRNATAGGIEIFGDSRVAIEHCRLENNGFGITVRNNAKTTIANTQVLGSTNSPPFLASGILFTDNASGNIFQTTVSGTRGVGIANRTGRANAVCAYLVNVFDNTTNYQGVIPTSDPCGFSSKGRTFSRY